MCNINNTNIMIIVNTIICTTNLLMIKMYFTVSSSADLF